MGHDSEGGVESEILTVNEHVFIFPKLSVAEQFTMVIPNGKLNGLAEFTAGLQVAAEIPLLSVAVSVGEYAVRVMEGTPSEGEPE